MLDRCPVFGRCSCLICFRDALAAVVIALNDRPDDEIHEPVPPGVPLLGFGHAIHRTEAVNEPCQLVFEISNRVTHGVY
jgi:hypothetical protein